jgi:hypothetical protein
MHSQAQDTDKRLPTNVQDVSTACCVFCPYGTDLKVGEQVYAFDEKTVLNHRQQERLVQVTAIKIFRSNGRVVTLDLKIANPEELQQIAQDSELPVAALINHRMGAQTYDAGRPPVVIYFRPCDEDGAGLARSDLQKSQLSRV